MQYILFVLTAVIVFSTIFFIPNSATSTHPSVAIDGAVTQSGCEVIGGTLVSDTIDVNHTQTIELCKFNTKHFRISSSEGCTLQRGMGQDPDSGETYEFNDPCDVPRPCNRSDAWGMFDVHFGHTSKLQVEVNGKNFDVIVTSNTIICHLEFVQHEKKISIIAKSINNTLNHFFITVPHELLSGEFNVMVDGSGTEFQTRDTKTDSIIFTQFIFSESEIGSSDLVERKIDIVGTHVIPEFPYYGAIVLVSAISWVLVARLLHNSNDMQGGRRYT